MQRPTGSVYQQPNQRQQPNSMPNSDGDMTVGNMQRNPASSGTSAQEAIGNAVANNYITSGNPTNFDSLELGVADTAKQADALTGMPTGGRQSPKRHTATPNKRDGGNRNTEF